MIEGPATAAQFAGSLKAGPTEQPPVTARFVDVTAYCGPMITRMKASRSQARLDPTFAPVRSSSTFVPYAAASPSGAHSRRIKKGTAASPSTCASRNPRLWHRCRSTILTD